MTLDRRRARPPERRERRVPAGISQTHAATTPSRPGHTARLAQAGDRVGHEVDDELPERRVDVSSANGSYSAAACLTSTPGCRSRAAATTAPTGRRPATASAPSRRTAAGQRAGAAADVAPPLPARDSRRVGELHES